MAETKIKYGSPTALTITSWTTTLAATQIAASAIVDNTSNLFVDALVGGLLEQGSSTPAAGDTFDIYAYGAWDTGTSSRLTGGIDGLFTGADEEEIDGTDLELGNMPLLAAVTADANVGFHFGPLSVAAVFGGRLPPKWGLVIHNRTGSAMASGSAVSYVGVTYTTV